MAVPEVAQRADDAIAKMEDDLAWRGPSDCPMGFVLLSREQAEALLRYIEAMEDELLPKEHQ